MRISIPLDLSTHPFIPLPRFINSFSSISPPPLFQATPHIFIPALYRSGALDLLFTTISLHDFFISHLSHFVLLTNYLLDLLFIVYLHDFFLLHFTHGGDQLSIGYSRIKKPFSDEKKNYIFFFYKFVTPFWWKVDRDQSIRTDGTYVYFFIFREFLLEAKRDRSKRLHDAEEDQSAWRVFQ